MWDRMIEKRNEGGFTLIELLIVIIILAILAAIVVFAVGTTGTNSKVAACEADAKSLETAIEAYHAQVGTYPTPGTLGGTELASTYYQSVTSAQQAALGTGSQTVGPWLRQAPGTAYYQILWQQSNGAIWVDATNTAAAPAAYSSTADFDLSQGNACVTAVGS